DDERDALGSAPAGFARDVGHHGGVGTHREVWPVLLDRAGRQHHHCSLRKGLARLLARHLLQQQLHALAPFTRLSLGSIHGSYAVPGWTRRMRSGVTAYVLSIHPFVAFVRDAAALYSIP